MPFRYSRAIFSGRDRRVFDAFGRDDCQQFMPATLQQFPQMGIVYVALLLPVAFGLLLRRNLKAWSVVTGALATSITFFVITNFAEWAFYDLYPHNASGLVAGYVAALPFFRNTVLSDLLFSGLISVLIGWPFRPACCNRGNRNLCRLLWPSSKVDWRQLEHACRLIAARAPHNRYLA